MANSPDPLANNPAIKDWAERFYTVMSWPMPTGDGDAVGDDALEQARAAALAKLGTITLSGELSAGARRSFAGGHKALKKEVLTATDMVALSTLDSDIDKLIAEITQQRLVAEARTKARAALNTAETLFAALGKLLDQGGFSYLEGRIAAAQRDMSAAVTKSAFEAVEAEASSIALKAKGAETYGAYFNNWTRASLLLINGMSDPAKGTATADRTAKMAAASALSLTGDFDGAKAKLEEWSANLATPGDLAGAVAFDDVMNEYLAKHHKNCQICVASPLRDARDYKDHLKEAKSLAHKDHKYKDAIAKIQELIRYGTDDRTTLARRLRGFDMSLMSNDGFKTAVLAANATQRFKGNNDPKQALKDLRRFEKANKELMAQSYATQILKSLKGKYEALVAVLKDPEKTDLVDTWAAHKTAVKAYEAAIEAKTANPVNGAPQYHAKLDALLRLDTVVDDRAEIRAILNTDSAIAAYEFDKPITDAISDGRYGDAIKAVPDALAQLRPMPEYLQTKEEAVKLLAALPADASELRDPLAAAITSAESKAAGGDAASATGDLRSMLDKADYLELALAMSDYRGKLKSVMKEHNQIKAFLKLKTAEDALDSSLKQATDAAAANAYGDAFLLLDRHQQLLKKAKPMATARYQVTGIIAALKRAKADAGALSPLEGRVPAAETEAGKPDFDKAKTLFDGIRSDLEALSKAAAQDYEDIDAAGTNAGHSLDRHGPDVTDEELIERLKTGKPPNAKTAEETAYTGASSKFESAQDWIAGREMAAQAAEAAGVDFAETEMTYPDTTGNQLESAAFTVEHGRPIDKAFVGVKRDVRLADGSDELIADKTYESYEEIEGLTRAYVNFIWVPEKLPEVTTDHPEPGTKHLEHKPQDNKDYATKYEARYGTKVTKIPGRWVMMQQFPVADGWDNDLKAYTNSPPGNMIPK